MELHQHDLGTTILELQYWNYNIGTTILELQYWNYNMELVSSWWIKSLDDQPASNLRENLEKTCHSSQGKQIAHAS